MARFIFSLFALVFAGALNAETRLLMFDSPGCSYCEQWTEEVGDAYHKTADGKRAPLWRIDINDDLPEGTLLNSIAVFTPTFVLLVDGQEIDRITGYPGEEFFWWMLEVMIQKLPPETEET